MGQPKRKEVVFSDKKRKETKSSTEAKGKIYASYNSCRFYSLQIVLQFAICQDNKFKKVFIILKIANRGIIY